MVKSASDLPRVLILHGIWNARSWVAPLAWRLRAEGFDAEVFGYDSVFGGPEAAIPRLIDHLQSSGGPIGLVGHSLGGVIALEALRQASDLPVPRVVCLGSPLRGSLTARNLVGIPGACMRSAAVDRCCCPAAQPGRARRRWAWWPATSRVVSAPAGPFEGESDGTVSVEETRLAGWPTTASSPPATPAWCSPPMPRARPRISCATDVSPIRKRVEPEPEHCPERRPEHEPITAAPARWSRIAAPSAALFRKTHG